MGRYIDDKDRIIKNMIIDPVTSCWEWKRNKNQKGYGRIRIDDRLLSAHRVSFAQFIGEIPDGLQVLHRCDNPGCVNPTHPWLGTNADNLADKMMKGRHRCGVGDNNGKSKLTRVKVLEIRHLIKSGHSQSAIAEKYGVIQTTISRVNTGSTWSHVKEGDQS